MRHLFRSVVIAGALFMGVVYANTETVNVTLPSPDETSVSVAPEYESLRSKSRSLLEISASNWAPNDFRTPARVAGVSAFSPAFPALNAALIFGTSDLHFRAGVGASRLRRIGQLNALSSTNTSAQSLFVFPVSVGAEYAPSALHRGQIGLHASALIGPDFVLADRSVLDDGGGAVGWLGEFSAGLLIGNAPQVALDGVFTAGRADGGDLAGVGVRAGLRFGL